MKKLEENYDKICSGNWSNRHRFLHLQIKCLQ